MMEFKERIISNYISHAPLALALERSFECLILSQQNFERPVLDIGCGDGIFAKMLFAEQVDTGIDPQQHELANARTSGMYQELICCDARKIPKPDGIYQTIFANSVFEHIVPIQEVLKEARRVLADNGRMYVTIPTDQFDRFTIMYQVLSVAGLKGLAEKFRAFFNRFWNHVHFYNEAGWRRLFEENGWIVVQCREYDPKQNCLLHDWLVPFGIISFLSRRFLNRWFIIPGLRKLYAPILSFTFSGSVLNSISERKRGGLVFFELTKKP